MFFWGCKKPAKIELGLKNLKKTSKIERSFIIYNRGDSDLVIEDFTTSCECTVMNMKKGQKILGRDSLLVPLSINEDKQNKDMVIFISIKTNTNPSLTSFKFDL